MLRVFTNLYNSEVRLLLVHLVLLSWKYRFYKKFNNIERTVSQVLPSFLIWQNMTVGVGFTIRPAKFTEVSPLPLGDRLV